MHNLPMEYFIATTHCSFSGPGSVQSDIQETLIKSQNYKYKLTNKTQKDSRTPPSICFQIRPQNQSRTDVTKETLPKKQTEQV